jgi:Cyclin, N-terminal domain
LSSMTCLYMAIKIHESEALQPQTIVQLSRGLFSVSQVEEMERRILFAIDWKVSPPTAWAFLHYYLDMAESWLSPMDSEYREQILQFAKLQIQCTSLEYYYSTKKASSIAHAALTNALKAIGILSPKIDKWLVMLGKRLEIDYCEVCTLEKVLNRNVPLCIGTLGISTVPVSTTETTPPVLFDSKKWKLMEDTTTKGPTNREVSSPRDVINCISSS